MTAAHLSSTIRFDESYMDQHLETLLAIIIPIVGATWLLRSKLSAIELATKGVTTAFLEHVKSDRQHFARHDARLRRIEGGARARRK